MADWTLNFKGNLTSEALKGASAVDTLSTALKKEQAALQAANVAMARGRAGGFDEKTWLKLSSAVALSKGRIHTLSSAIADAKKQGVGATKLGVIDAIEKSGGPIGGFIRNVKAAWNALKENPSAAVAVGLGVLAASAVTVASKLYDIGKAALTMGVGFADAARSARLLNEAADLAAGTHNQLGGIIEDVRKRSDVGRDRLSEMGRELRKLRFDSRQTQIVLSAMAVAESTLGQEASGGVKAIAEQSRGMRRFSLGARDAYGQFTSLTKIGLSNQDLFAEISKSSGKSMGEVKRSVQLGGVGVKAGMVAIEAALRTKFGGTVAAQALSLGSQLRRMQEDFEGLFVGADIEPLLKGLRSITSIFSQDTSAGRSFTTITKGLIDGLGKTAEALGPDIKEFFLELSASAAQPGGLAESIRGWVQDAKSLGSTLKEIAEAIKSIGAAAKSVSGAFSWVGDKFTSKADQGELDTINRNTRIEKQLADQGKLNGQALTAGIAAGVEAGAPGALGSITTLAAGMSAAFKAFNKQASPSKLYRDDSRNIPRGAAAGVRAETPVAVASIARMSSDMHAEFNAAGSSTITNTSRGGDTNVTIQKLVYEGAADDGLAFIRTLARLADAGPQPVLP